MAHSENNILSYAFKTFFERETLTGLNFNEWYRSLRIVLRVADTFDYLYKPCPDQPADTATEAEKAAFRAKYKKHSDVACIMLGKINSEHVLEMKGLMDQLHTLGKPYDNDMAVNLINRSLNKDFGDFVRNFNMHCVGKTVTELHALLIDFKKGLKDKAPTPQVFTIQKGRDNKPKPQANKKVKGKGKADKNKQVMPYQPKLKPNPLKRKENPNKDQACHHCHVVGHWKRNCPLYLEELRANKKKSEPSAAVSGNLFAIELFNLTYKLNSWVYDTRCGIHVCNTLQGFKKKGNYLMRLAHIGKTRIQKLHSEGLLENIDEESFDKCESCISGKMTKKPFNKNIERATDLLGLIHTDVCGPLRHVSRKGASYFLTFTDDFSRYGYVFLLKHKHEVFETFKVFKAEVELQLGKKIKALRSDRGGEYLSQEFKDYLSENGIVQNLTSPYTPQQNGVSERRNRTLLDMVRSMFNLTTLPLSFWDYALESAVRILNMVPTKKVDKTPYEIWHGKAPNLSYLKVWGCEAYVKRDSADKLQQRSVKCIFVGYPKETMGYYFYFPPENKVIVARYGDFLERDLISQKFSGRDYDLEDDHMDTLPSENTSEIPVEPESLGPPSKLIPVRRSEKTTRAPNRLCLNMKVEDDEVGDLGEPANYKTVMFDPDKAIWQGAMDKEMKSMNVNKVWIVVDRPSNAKVVRNKWLYKKKTDMDGKVHTYKARLVAKGCTQTFGIDYQETFSPVADIRAIRILIAIAAYYDYEI
nr:retrotransposon protein, putative, Ty1-copia subclass [Tanacetum cinerariifolium]